MLEEPENNEEEAPEEVAEEAPAEEAPAAESPEPEGAAPAEADPGPSGAATAEEQLSSKERRRRERSSHTEPKPQRSPEERAADRAGVRAKKAAERRRWRQSSRAKRKSGGPREDTTPAPLHGPTGRRRERQGVVVSDRGDKTITVRIEVQRAHRTYGKVVRSSSTLHVHDETNDANAGDTVRVVESRPISRHKRWRLAEILERAR
jgi:small subunit ribosomal protein S17